MASSPDLPWEELRCLWVARTIPLPPISGANQYAAHLAKAIAGAGALVTFIGLSTPIALRLAAEFENRIEWSTAPGRPNPTILALASPLPLVAARFGTREYARHLKTTLHTRRFDAIILDHFSMVWTIKHLLRRARDGVRPLIVYIAHNFETQVAADIARNFRGSLFRRAALCANAWKTTNAEHTLVHAADLIVTTTPEDAERFAQLSPLTANLALPPGYDGAHARERRIGEATPRRVALVGSHRWTAKQMNLAAFLEVADPILCNAGIELDIAGEMPPSLQKAWQRRARATRFHGFVENLGEFLQACRMGLVIDETGGGFKLKALDYIFNRVPIAAIRGSLAGLPLSPGQDYLSFGSMRELAQGIASGIDDIERLNLLQRAAYEKCSSGFDWVTRGRTFYDAIQEAVHRTH